MSIVSHPGAESAALPPAMCHPLPVMRFSVEQYHAMAKAGNHGG